MRCTVCIVHALCSYDVYMYICILQDARLLELVTGVRAAARSSFMNGYAKTVSMNIISLIRGTLCPRHNVRLSV